MPWSGFSQGLQTPGDLLRKMEYDLERMRAAPGDPSPAFDFFVAAEHMVDWRYPHPHDAAKRKEVRRHDPARTVSHLASGAKHFIAEDRRHGSVGGVATEADFETSVLDRGSLDEMRLDSPGRPALVITMSDGRRVDATRLAELVVAYWRTEMAPGGMHAREPSDD